MRKILFVFLFIAQLLVANSKQDTIEKIGDYVQIAIPVAAWVTTIALDDTEGQYDFYKSFGSTFLTTHALKRIVKEERPNGSNDQSFPSGHTSAAFQGATFIHMRYGIEYAALAYVGAIYVGFSRVYSDQHYVHDVIAGALIGSAFSWYFTKPYKIKNIEIQPTVFDSADKKHNLYGVKVKF
jgi:membrane-associated phospholipid phosphatase